MATKIELIGGLFQAADGTIVANGTMTLEINQDCTAATDIAPAQISSGSIVTLNLGNDGNLVNGQFIWSNNDITPAGTFYIVKVYTATGQLVWGPNLQQVTNFNSQFNASNWIPNDINPNP